MNIRKSTLEKTLLQMLLTNCELLSQLIKGFADTIYELPEISSDMLTEFAEKIVRNCERMDSLVKNLLILADLDLLPKARLQEVDLVGMIDSCSHSLLSFHPEIEIQSFHNGRIHSYQWRS